MYLISYEFPPSTWCEKATKTSKLIFAAIFIQCNHVFSMSGCIHGFVFQEKNIKILCFYILFPMFLFKFIFLAYECTFISANHIIYNTWNKLVKEMQSSS